MDMRVIYLKEPVRVFSCSNGSKILYRTGEILWAREKILIDTANPRFKTFSRQPVTAYFFKNEKTEGFVLQEEIESSLS